ncbi:50S ribosomal protein L23 [Brucepastera parasyntrophica]|uniref:50S ribosomal protein L23 n=1 Tax=Brucepastera parasyntrophica TaxID=2880008 RepID=UPI0021086B3A|nr:50S ribosomal protein L23 [Brucepastera parasyntrophica]ULQ59314.1 50S ribosomal protein L23 [Brucepastera parasyntrophica]
MTAESILIAPILTEKTNELRSQGKYVFKVHPSANKIQIKNAVHALFNVKVINCTVINVYGKVKRTRNRPGLTSSWKKAIVKLAPGETIKVFEGV